MEAWHILSSVLIRNSEGITRGALLPVVALAVWGCAIGETVRHDAAREGSRESVHSSSRSNTGSLQLDAISSSYIIAQGDHIDISVWGYPEFSTTAVVKETGTVTVPLIGEVLAEGLTKQDFVERLLQKLSDYVKGEPKLMLSILSPVSQKVTVLGAVTRQDNYPVTAEVSLVEIISAAGGPTAESDLYRVKIIRREKRGDPIVIDLAWYMENGRLDQLPKVRPGDTVFVPRRENLVRAFSEFLRDVVLLFGFFRVLN